jgi:hypothetical protein
MGSRINTHIVGTKYVAVKPFNQSLKEIGLGLKLHKRWHISTHRNLHQGQRNQALARNGAFHKAVSARHSPARAVEKTCAWDQSIMSH